MMDITAMERVKEKLATAKKAMIFDFNGAPVYKYPNEKSEIIGWLDMYARFYVYNEVNGFYYVSSNLNFGYVPKYCAVQIIE